MPISEMPYQYDEHQQEDQDPYARPHGGENGSPDSTGPINDTTTARRPEPYRPPSNTPANTPPASPPGAPPPETFTQMQEQGRARPPIPVAPSPNPVNTTVQNPWPTPPPAPPPHSDAHLPPTPNGPPPNSLHPDPRPYADLPWYNQPHDNAIDLTPPPPPGWEGQPPGGHNPPQLPNPADPPPPAVPPGPPQRNPNAEAYDQTLDEIRQSNNTPAPVAPSGGTTDLLGTMLSGVNGTGAGGALRDATTAATLKQLQNPSPYNSDEVKNEYNWAAGNIDDQYAENERKLDESMASRGLFGSAGKDFHSGRLSDLNVGQRTAKESLARDLAQKYAETKGQYDANAINQGQSGANADSGNQMNWLNALMGYGNDAFNHDLQTAQFNAGQNQDYQHLLEQMLAAGYGG